LADLILTLPTERARQNQRPVLALRGRPLDHLHAPDRPVGFDRQTLVLLQRPAYPLELSQLVLRRLPGRHRLSKELLLFRDEDVAGEGDAFVADEQGRRSSEEGGGLVLALAAEVAAIPGTTGLHRKRTSPSRLLYNVWKCLPRMAGPLRPASRNHGR